MLQKSSYNPNARAAQHYNIVEDLAKAPSTMSTLKVLQSCPSRQKALLSAIEGIDPYDSNLICFDLEDHVLHLPHQIVFLIQVIINEKTIHKTVVDEGASTCIMSVSRWKEIGSPTLNQSPKTLEAFSGHNSWPFSLLPNLAITLEGKAVNVQVEIVDANLICNLLLEQSWTHAMNVVVSSIFHVLRFPHQGKNVMGDQLSFFASSSLDGNVPYMKHTGAPYESVGVGIFKDPTLMGIFPLPPPHVASVNMISVKSDPWVIPSPNLVDTWGDFMPLSPAEINYVEIILASASVPTIHIASSTSLDTYFQSPWLGSSDSPDPLTDTFPSDEREIMSLEEAPWNNTHHRSSFLTSPVVMSTFLEKFSSHFPSQPLQIPTMTHEFWSEGNMVNITQMMPIDISVKPGIIENIHIGVTCSPDDIKLHTRLF